MLVLSAVSAIFFALPLLAAPIVILPDMRATYSQAPLAIARITSDFELRSVTAAFETQTVALAFSPAFGDWRAATPFDISASPSGTNTVTFTATDPFGNTAQTNVSFLLDRPPTLEILSPNAGSLARPTLYLSASVRDDLSVPRVSIWSALAGWGPGGAYEWFIHNQPMAHPSGVIDLSTWEESAVDIKFQAFDSSGFDAYDLRQVLSLSNPRYQHVLSTGGAILDLNSEAVLYHTNGQLISFNRSTGQSTVLKNGHARNVQIDAERLTPTGAIVNQAEVGSPWWGRLLDLNRGEEIDLGKFYNLLITKGRFALFNTDGQTVLRDLIARTNVVLPIVASDADLGENGTVFLSARISFGVGGNAVYRFANGQLTSLTDTNEARYLIQTDGTNVLWHDVDYQYFPSYVPTTITLLTPQGPSILVTNLPFSGGQPAGSQRAAINNGWVAFPRPGTQVQEQLWLRSPSGEFSQATFFTRSSHLRALFPNGSLIVALDGSYPVPPTLYHIPLHGTPKRLGKDFASYSLSGTNLSAHILGHVFDVEVEDDPVGLTSPQYDSASGLLSYYVTASLPGLFTLQRSTNFVDWTALTRITVTNTAPAKFQVSTPPGFFRLQEQ